MSNIFPHNREITGFNKFGKYAYEFRVPGLGFRVKELETPNTKP